MAVIVSDNREVTRCLRHLVDLVTDDSGRVTSAIRFVCENGDLWVEGTGLTEPDGGVLRLDRRSLLPVDGAAISLKGECLRLDAAPAFSSEQRALLTAHLELLNLTGKVADCRVRNPWLGLMGMPDFLQALARGRSENDNIRRFLSSLRAGDLERLTIDLLIGSRTVLSEGQPCLMPLADLFNHHIGGAAFHFDGGGLRLRRRMSVEGRVECFARYGVLDALDSYLFYGFVDRQVAFIRSVPLEIEMGELGRLSIRSLVTSPDPKAHSKESAGFWHLVPKILEKRPGYVRLSHICIPAGRNAGALRQILASVCDNMGTAGDDKHKQRAVEQAEREIVMANETFYADLKGQVAKLPTSPAVDEARVLIDLQASKIASYRAII